MGRRPQARAGGWPWAAASRSRRWRSRPTRRRFIARCASARATTARPGDRSPAGRSIASAAAAGLGTETPNPGYADPAPWTERHPAVLWVALVVAVAVVGALAIRTLKSAAPREVT